MDQHSREHGTDVPPGRSVTRRSVVKAGIAAAGLGIAGMASVRTEAQTPAASEATATPCLLTPELTEGPYYVPGQLIRQDITEGKPGVPLTLRITVQDVTTCSPLANAAVDIWHCDAQGYYSGITGENPGGGSAPAGQENAQTTFLRGVQLTDATGQVTFRTIYPGWYAGRTIHIHMKVHVGGAPETAAADPLAAATPEGGLTYQGGHSVHTGQLFFDEAISAQVLATPAYARESDQGRIHNAQDNIFNGHGDEPGFLLDLSGFVDEGLIGTITVGVDPSAVSAGR